jgi:hypothetical protein
MYQETLTREERIKRLNKMLASQYDFLDKVCDCKICICEHGKKRKLCGICPFDESARYIPLNTYTPKPAN